MAKGDRDDEAMPPAPAPRGSPPQADRAWRRRGRHHGTRSDRGVAGGGGRRQGAGGQAAGGSQQHAGQEQVQPTGAMEPSRLS